MRFILFIVVGICFCQLHAAAQERKLIYDVVRKEKIIGKIDFVETVQGNKKFLSMTSDVKTKYIFAFSDNTSETAAYVDGVMMYSSFYQKQTGSGTTNKYTIASGNAYKLTDGAVETLKDISPIRYNMLLLYTDIPVAIDKVYSANFQQMLSIKKMEDNRYRLTLPDGKYNYYTYKNGVCTMVEIVRTLFTLQFVLREH